MISFPAMKGKLYKNNQFKIHFFYDRAKLNIFAIRFAERY
jgi:hypothetical protein